MSEPPAAKPTAGHALPARSGITLAGSLAVVLVAIGGINWGLVGIARFDAVAWLFGPMSPVSRVIYVVVGLAALYCLYKLPRWSRAG